MTSEVATSRRALAHEWWAILGIAVAVLALHLVTNGQYDFQRDELYYMDAARHPAFGYVDFPPVTPLIARLSLSLFGVSVWGLRLWPSLASAVMVILTALTARELGAGRAGRLLAALAAATSLVLLGANWLFQTVTFDQVVWLTCLYLLARLVRTGDRRLWLALGAAVGVGLETKYTILALAVGIVIATLTTHLRPQLRTRWPWLGAAIAVVIFLPNLVWQVANGWPSLAFTVNHQAAQSDFSPVAFLSQQPLLIGPLALPLWIAGLAWLLRDRRRRPLGIAAAFALLLFLVVGKGYYVGPLHPFLLGAGACAVARVRPSRRRWLLPVTTAALLLEAALLLPLAVPVETEPAMARSALASLRTDFADTVGWPDLAAQVATVYSQLPPAQRASAVIITSNYGEAGAVDTYGPSHGLPAAYSGELTYYFWGPPTVTGAVIAVGFDPTFIGGLFSDCTTKATLSNPYGLHNQEYGQPIAVCRGPRETTAALWAQLKSFQ